MVETVPVLAHAADRIALRRDRIPTRVLLEEVERARSRSRAQERFIPAVTIELEEAARPVRALGVADEEFDVHVTNDARAASVDLAIEAREPVGAFALTSHRQVGRIAASERRVHEAEEMRAVEADLDDVGPRLAHEIEIGRVVVISPVRDEAGE